MKTKVIKRLLFLLPVSVIFFMGLMLLSWLVAGLAAFYLSSVLYDAVFRIDPQEEYCNSTLRAKLKGAKL